MLPSPELPVDDRPIADLSPRLEGISESSTFGRVALGVGANAVGKLWVLALQFLSVPILVTQWGAQGYGIWLMLSAIPTYIALSDLGFGAAGAVDMTKCVAQGDRDGALTAFQSVWLFVTLFSIAILFAAVSGWFIYRHFAPSAARDVADAALLLAVLALVVLQMSLINIAFRSLGRYAEGTFYFDLAWPVEGIAVLVVALLGGYLVAAAAAILTIRILSFGMYYFYLRRLASWVKLGWGHARLSEIRALARPAMAAMGLPLSTALNIQGTMFIVGLTLSPAVAAMFATVRTISRVPIQVVGMLTRASLPEITISYTRADQRKLDRLVGTNIFAVILVAVPSAIAIVLFGPAVLAFLSRGRLSASITVFLLMAAITALQTLWNTVGSFLASLNLQHRFTYAYTASSVLACVLSYFAARSFGINLVVAIMVAVDALMTIVVIAQWNAVSNAQWRDYLGTINLLPALFGRLHNLLVRRS